MINTAGEVKLIDFGQATTIRLTQKKVMGIMQVKGEGEREGKREREGKEREKEKVCLTQHQQYASPEMMARGKLDGGMDIWALGMSMIGFLFLFCFSCSVFSNKTQPHK